MYAPEPYDGIKYLLNGFLLQCCLYHDNLVEPKPTERTWVELMLSRLMGEHLIASRQPRPHDATQFEAEASVYEPEANRVANREAINPGLPPVADKDASLQSSLQRSTGQPTSLCSCHR